MVGATFGRPEPRDGADKPDYRTDHLARVTIDRYSATPAGVALLRDAP